MKMTDLRSSAEIEAERLASQKANLAVTAEIATAELTRKQAVMNLELSREASEMKLRIDEEVAKTTAIKDRAEAISPDLISALATFGERSMIEKTAEAMAPLAMLKGTGVLETIGALLKGTGVEKAMSLASNRD
jgi:hypothetical protein